MWIFTNKGFLSVVRHRDKRNHLLVRARENGVLEEIFGPNYTDERCVIEENPDADYRFRTVVHEGYFRQVMNYHIDEITYDNFKNSIPPDKADYHDACMDVWSTMHRLQESVWNPEGSGLFKLHKKYK